MTSLAAFGQWSMSDIREKLRTVYEDRFVPLVQISSVFDSHYRIRLAVLIAITGNEPNVAKAKMVEIQGLMVNIAEQWQAYDVTYLTSEEKAIAKATGEAMTAYDAARMDALAKFAAGDLQGGRALALEKGGPTFAELRDRLLALSELQKSIAAEEYVTASGAYERYRILTIGLALVASAFGAPVAWAIGGSITKPLNAIIEVMQALTNSNLSVEASGSKRKDEVGAVAEAVLVFKDGMVETERLRGEQEHLKTQAEAERRRAMLDLADRFETTICGVVGAVRSAATELQATAQSLSATAEEQRFSLRRLRRLLSRRLGMFRPLLLRLRSCLPRSGRQVAKLRARLLPSLLPRQMT